MSCFSACEFCDRVGAKLCNCSSTPRFCCNVHIIDHMNSKQGVAHPFEDALVNLSKEDIDSLREAARTYQKRIILEANSQRNNLISSLLQKIRRIEEDYSSLIENVLNGEIKQTVEQLILEKSLPLFSSSSFLNSLVSLMHSQTFKSTEILKKLLLFSSSSQQNASLYLSKLSINTCSTTSIPVKAKRDKETEINSNIRVIEKQDEIKIYPKPQYKLSQEINAHNENIIYKKEIACIAVSDCNRYFASASLDYTVKIWDARSYKLLRTLEGHENWVLSVSFLGENVVSGSNDKTIKIWEREKCIKTLGHHSDWVIAVSISSSKNLIASGSRDSTVAVYNIESDNILYYLRSHRGWVRSVVFSEDDREIYSGSDDRTIKVWKTEIGELLRTLYAHEGPVYCVRISGNLIVSSSEDKSIRVWEKYNSRSLMCLNGHTEAIKSIDICNKVVVSISDDNSMRVWDLESGEQIQSFKGHGSSSIFYIGHKWVGSLKILEEGRFIVSGGRDGKIKVWRRKRISL